MLRAHLNQVRMFLNDLSLWWIQLGENVLSDWLESLVYIELNQSITNFSSFNQRFRARQLLLSFRQYFCVLRIKTKLVRNDNVHFWFRLDSWWSNLLNVKDEYLCGSLSSWHRWWILIGNLFDIFMYLWLALNFSLV